MFCGSIPECLPRQVPHLPQFTYGQEHMKLVKPFTPHVIACSVRKGFRSVDLQNERAESEIAVFS